jgi:ribosomal small subunit protein bTHX
MGKGDKKTARGKRIMKSSGVTRQRKKSTYKPPVEEAKPAAKKAAPKKPAAKKATTKKAAPKKATKKTEE